jgi:acyl transferase domain-containing protein
VTFLFPGQGAQYPEMGRGLYETEPAFRAEVDECCARLQPLLGLDLRMLLHPAAEEVAAAAERLAETRFTQPALFTIEYALARLWATWGVRPESMIGHSVGEYVAACLAGVMTRDDALDLVAERARLMQDCPRGAMLAVALSEHALGPLIGGSLDLAAVNGPDACVVAGPAHEIAALAARLRERDVPASPVPTSHAFHSALMQPALAPFAARVAGVPRQAPRIPFVSNVTGTWITDEEATSPAYWARQMASTVRFAEGLTEVLKDSRRILLEVGPGLTLSSLAKRRFARGSVGLAAASLRHPRDQERDETFIRQAAARLWSAGAAVDLSASALSAGARRALLPTYPFERERYVLETAPSSTRTATADKAAGVDAWLYAPSWRRGEPASSAAPTAAGDWCVFTERGGPGDALVRRLREQGQTVIGVRPGVTFARESEWDWVLDPSRRTDHERLFTEVSAAGGLPECVVHFCGAKPDASTASLLVDPAFVSVLNLARALGARQNRPTTLIVVTSAAVEVTGHEALAPSLATVLGLGRVISQEYPLLRCRNVDVEPAAADADVAEQVLSETAPWCTEAVVAYRGRYRWVQCFDRLAATAARPVPPRVGGVYLITGGLGKVGLALAEHLVRTRKARLVLTSRFGLPDPERWDGLLASATADDVRAARVRAVRKLTALGGDVLVLQADAAATDDMRRAIAVARERFGALHGVIHAAADLAAGSLRSLAQMEAADCEAQFRPKVRAAEVLDEVLGDEPLDFVMLASSVSALLGGLGFGAYAAANAQLDAFARRQHQRGRRAWISVDWDGWRFEPSPDTEAASEAVRVAMSPAEGVAVFERILALAGMPQVVVSTVPLAERLEKWTTVELGEERQDDAAVVHPRPELHTVFVAPEDAIERRVAEIWSRLLGLDRVGVDDNFFELGGSSLVGLHLVGQVKKEFAAELSAATLFEAPTVRALSRVIRGQGGAENELGRSQDRGQMRRLNRRGQRRTSDAAVE